MRQSGVLVHVGEFHPMCLYALDHHVERLAEDHALASTIAARIADLRWPMPIASVTAPQTNLLFFTIDEQGPTGAALTESCARHGVQIGSFGPRQIRVVTHLDVFGDVDPLIEPSPLVSY